MQNFCRTVDPLEARWLETADYWRLLMVGGNGGIHGCMAYRPHRGGPGYQEANSRGVGSVEIKIWAREPGQCPPADCVRLGLCAYALARILGHSGGLITTNGNAEFTQLRRIGAHLVEGAVGEGTDAIEMRDRKCLRFDSGSPNLRYGAWIDSVTKELLTTRVICATQSQSERRNSTLKLARPVAPSL